MFAWFQADIISLLNRPPIHTNLHRLDDTAMGHLVMTAAERLQVTKADDKELGSITTVFGAMVYNLGRMNATLAQADLTERLYRELAAANAPPTPMIIGAAPGVAASAAAFGMQAGKRIGTQKTSPSTISRNFYRGAWGGYKVSSLYSVKHSLIPYLDVSRL